jgi:H+/gluconate symporter-like permease
MLEVTTLLPLTGVLAYVGPGPGLSLTWALVGLIATIFTALFAVLFWPIRVLLRKIRGGEPESEESDEDAGDDEAEGESNDEPDDDESEPNETV